MHGCTTPLHRKPCQMGLRSRRICANSGRRTTPGEIDYETYWVKAIRSLAPLTGLNAQTFLNFYVAYAHPPLPVDAIAGGNSGNGFQHSLACADQRRICLTGTPRASACPVLWPGQALY